MNYMGSSMNPTLKAGDGITVIPYGYIKISIGDVVVFPHPEGNDTVVHRVVALASEGIRTRGDNNLSMDPWVLPPDDIIGRVVSAQRKNRHINIHGRIRGRIIASALRAIKHVNLSVSRILHPFYHWLIKTRILIKCNRFFPKTRILAFNRPMGQEFQLLMGNRIIGRRLPGRDQWQILKPFRLIVNETSLPK
jgi:signal peptidase I